MSYYYVYIITFSNNKFYIGKRKYHKGWTLPDITEEYIETKKREQYEKISKKCQKNLQ